MLTSTTLLPGLPRKQALIFLLQERARRQQLALVNQQAQTATHPPSRSRLDDAHSSLVIREGHPFHDLLGKSRYKVYYGGRDSGKSWAFAEALIRRATFEPLRILCTREFQTSIKDSVHKLLCDTIKRLGLDDWFEITNTSIRSKAGAEFIFKGIRDSDIGKVKSTEGIDICWVEEAQYTSADSWLTLIPTIRKEGSEIWVSFNVTDEQSPTHKRFITSPLPGNISHFVNYDQNPFLSTESKREIEWLREVDLEAFNHVYGGMAKRVSDAIIFGGRYEVKAFDDHLSERAERVFYGADWGFSQDPTALIRFFMMKTVPDDPQSRLYDLYIEHEAWGIGVEFAGEITPDGRGELERLFDSVPGSRNHPIKADNARPETISFMRGKGFIISDAEKWKGSVEDGIAHIKGFRKIFIHPRCKHTIQEAGLYAFKRDKITNEVLTDIIDKHNHTWDAIRYGLDGYIQRGGDLGIWARLGMPQ
jgi:phage terminase large subunit